jgi:hypothetical protein
LIQFATDLTARFIGGSPQKHGHDDVRASQALAQPRPHVPDGSRRPFDIRSAHWKGNSMKTWTIASIVAAALMSLGLISVPASAHDRDYGRYGNSNYGYNYNYNYNRHYDRGDHHRYGKKWRKHRHWRHNNRWDRHRWHDRNDRHRWHGKKRRHRDRDHYRDYNYNYRY